MDIAPWDQYKSSWKPRMTVLRKNINPSAQLWISWSSHMFSKVFGELPLQDWVTHTLLMEQETTSMKMKSWGKLQGFCNVLVIAKLPTSWLPADRHTTRHHLCRALLPHHHRHVGSEPKWQPNQQEQGVFSSVGTLNQRSRFKQVVNFVSIRRDWSVWRRQGRRPNMSRLASWVCGGATAGRLWVPGRFCK